MNGMNRAIIHIALFPKSCSLLEQFAKLIHIIGMYRITANSSIAFPPKRVPIIIRTIMNIAI